VYKIKAPGVLVSRQNGVALVKLKRVIGLRLSVNSYDSAINPQILAGLVVAHCGAARFAVQVKNLEH